MQSVVKDADLTQVRDTLTSVNNERADDRITVMDVYGIGGRLLQSTQPHTNNIGI